MTIVLILHYLHVCNKVISEGMHNLPENHWPQGSTSPNLPAFVQGPGEVFMLCA